MGDGDPFLCPICFYTTTKRPLGISYNERSQRATLAFNDEIPVSSKALLEIKYSGVMNNLMAGFYRSKYKPAVAPAASVPKDSEYHYMFSTQFESCDARRALPCFDEPNLKASFDFEIEIPEDQVALSNMPEKEIKKGRNGRKIVSFVRTPAMSTYVSIMSMLAKFTNVSYSLLLPINYP